MLKAKKMNKINTPKKPKELGLYELIAIGVGGMIGGGIFSVLGLAVGISGHAAPLAFLIGSFIALSAGYSYVRLALAFRKDGASFTYLERAFPKKLYIAGISGWIIVIGYIGTLALYAFTFSAYATHLFGIEKSHLLRLLFSVFILVLFMAINILGTKLMGRTEDIIVYLKIVLLTLLGGVGFFTLKTAHFTPIFNNGLASVFLGGAVIFVAFEGFQLITNAIEETKSPDKNIPKGVFASIIITSVIYIAITIVAVGNLGPGALLGAKEYALAIVSEPILGKLGVVLVDIAAIFATSSAINGTLFGSSRLASEMATDSLAPRIFSFHNRTNVPLIAIIIITILASIFTVFSKLEVIATFSSVTFLFVSMAVSVANLKLYKTTRSRISLIILGLVLMSVTVVLLFVYVAKNIPWTLLFIVIVYAITVLAHLLFERFRQHIKTKKIIE
jgi:amino acid transporter